MDGIKTSKNLSETHPHLKEFSEFLDEFNKETERGAALLAAALLDEMLRRIIAAYLIPNEGAEKLLSGFNAPLGSFSARISAALALGVINEVEAAECGRLRKIRNEFAHGVKVSFKNPVVVRLCGGLALAIKGEVDDDTARRRFTTAAVALILHLTNRAHYVGLRQLVPQNWPR